MRAWDWWQSHRNLALPYAGESLVTTTAAQLYLYGVAAVAGISAVAAIRGAEVVLGPVQVVIQGAQLTAVPYGVRALTTSTSRLRSQALFLMGALVIVTAFWGVMVSAIPQALGVSLLGSTWSRAHGIFVPMTIEFIALAIAAAASVGLRALAAAIRSLRASFIGAVVIVIGGTAGSAFGAPGAAWGLALAALAQAIVFWREFAVALHEPRARSPMSGAVAEPDPGRD
jgi:hypothetical protein